MDSHIELLNQCHEHLRESNRKKDTILGFYLTATFIILGFYANASALSDMSFVMWICFMALVIAGQCIGILLTLYRGWHGFYIISSIVIQELINNSEEKVSFDFIKRIKFKFSSIISVEFFTFMFLHIFISLNIYIMFYAIPILNDNSFFSEGFCRMTSYILLVCFIFELIAHFVGMIILDRYKQNGNLNEKYLWILHGKITKNESF